MKLSDMFSTLAENARTYEKRVAEWQDEMNSRNDEMMASARKWQETAMYWRAESKGSSSRRGWRMIKRWKTCSGLQVPGCRFRVAGSWLNRGRMISGCFILLQ